MKLKDRAKAKAERRAARAANPRTEKGPPIATDEGTTASGPLGPQLDPWVPES